MNASRPFPFFVALLLHVLPSMNLKSEKRERGYSYEARAYSKQLLHTFPYSVSLVTKATRLTLSILLDMKLGLVKSQQYFRVWLPK